MMRRLTDPIYDLVEAAYLRLWDALGVRLATVAQGLLVFCAGLSLLREATRPDQRSPVWSAVLVAAVALVYWTTWVPLDRLQRAGRWHELNVLAEETRSRWLSAVLWIVLVSVDMISWLVVGVSPGSLELYILSDLLRGTRLRDRETRRKERPTNSVLGGVA